MPLRWSSVCLDNIGLLYIYRPAGAKEQRFTEKSVVFYSTRHLLSLGSFMMVAYYKHGDPPELSERRGVWKEIPKM